MNISVRCKCGVRLHARDDKAGSTAICPKCQSRVLLPGDSKEASQQLYEPKPWLPKLKLWVCLQCNMENDLTRTNCRSCGNPRSASSQQTIAIPSGARSGPSKKHQKPAIAGVLLVIGVVGCIAGVIGAFSGMVEGQLLVVATGLSGFVSGVLMIAVSEIIVYLSQIEENTR